MEKESQISCNKGLLESIRESNCVVIDVNKKCTKEEIESFFKDLTELSKQPRTYTYSAYILYDLLCECKTKEDVLNIDKVYKNTTWIGGLDAITLVNNKLKEFGL